MTLKEYMQLRMGKCKVNALTNKEAKIFGLELKKGWFIQNGDMEITDEMLDKLGKIKTKSKYLNKIRKKEVADDQTLYARINALELKVEKLQNLRFKVRF